MAGYIFNLDSTEALDLYTRAGVYATRLSDPPGRWQSHHEGTFADFATMQPNDNIYFFIDRKIYGIGRLINIGPDCKYFNYPAASIPETPAYTNIRGELLWDEGDFSINQRCLCTFEPDPHFFIEGIDMDDVLSSNPRAFKMLRAFWKLSFLKFSDEENQAFRDILLKRNEDRLILPPHGVREHAAAYGNILTKPNIGEYNLFRGLANVLSSCADEENLRHEMAIEAGLLNQLHAQDPETIEVFGTWDYLSHQVVASPFKPIDYMDKMDIFGYSFIEGFGPTKNNYLVIEIKKGDVEPQDIDQLLKYVDWICGEYCFGDYSMIKAFLVGFNFPDDVLNHKTRVANRKFTRGMRPAQSLEWNDLTLVNYRFNEAERKLQFTPIN